MAGTTSRDLLVAAARDHLDEHGLEGLSLRAVARRAGVSHGAPLRHFPSLASLCSAVAAQAFAGLYAEAAATMDEAGEDPLARLRAAGQAYVQFAVANPGPYSLMFRPDRWDPSDAELQANSGAAFAQILYATSEAQAAGWRVDDHTAEVAGVIWATVHGLASLTIQGSLPAAVAGNGGDADLAHLLDLAQDALGTDSPEDHMTTTASQWLSGNFAPVTEEVTALDLEVTGTLPEGLDGRYVRNGPNPRGDVDPATYHWFTGDGMVHGVRLRDGKAEWYRNRWTMPAAGENAPNTNVISQGGRTWAIVESGPVPVELTHELDPVAANPFDGTIEGPYTAHPKRDPHTGELHAVSYHWAWDHLRYSVVGTDGRARRELHIPVADGPMVHDCALTENHVVLFDLPVTFDLEEAMTGSTFPYHWNPDHGARVGLLPREAEADAVRWFDVELCYVYHPLNAYEDDEGRVVVDVVRHPSMFDRDRLGPNEGSTRLDRWTIDPAKGKVVEEVLDDTHVELPRHDERLLGRPYRYGYAPQLIDAFGHFGAVKYDLRSGETQHRTYGEGRVSDELVFVPRSPDSGEDEGWLLSYVYDATTNRSDLVILAADDFTGDPVASVHLPQRVPFGFHGNWMAET